MSIQKLIKAIAVAGIGLLVIAPVFADDRIDAEQAAITTACATERADCIAAIDVIVVRTPETERGEKITQIVTVLQSLSKDADGNVVSSTARRPLVAAVSHLASLQTDTQEMAKLQMIAIAIRNGK